VAVILAAGSGLRVGGSIRKQYQPIGDEALLCHTVRAFVTYNKISQLVVVVPVGGIAQAQGVLGNLAKRVLFVEGGTTRQQSALLALRALSVFSPDYVHIHDGARPFVCHDLLDRLNRALTPQSGVVPTLAVTDTLKKVGKTGEIIATLDRQGLYQAQTPQSFPFAAILAAHEQAALSSRENFTDDSSVAEWYGLKMQHIEGSIDNVKITQKADMERANRLADRNDIFPDIRTGNGYDVHRLEAGDGVILCGVKLPCPFSLYGHSDADVALHALTDALLATLGAGDIGVHFPPSDEQWRGASSDIFVSHALDLVRARNGRIANIDITLIAEAPKITPHREAMISRLAELLSLEPDRISVKATTNERLGFIGRGEGIAAIATANVLYPGQVPSHV